MQLGSGQLIFIIKLRLRQIERAHKMRFQQCPITYYFTHTSVPSRKPTVSLSGHPADSMADANQAMLIKHTLVNSYKQGYLICEDILIQIHFRRSDPEVGTYIYILSIKKTNEL